ncbi:hypothetical protein GCM10010458_16680 [Microbacterium luteolum]
MTPDGPHVKPLRRRREQGHPERDDITEGAIMTDSTPDQGAAPATDEDAVHAQTPEQVHTTDDAASSGDESSGEATTPAEADSPEQADPDEIPSTEQLEEPSTEKDPGEEPKAPKREEPEPDHEAVGIGVIDTEEPQAD